MRPELRLWPAARGLNNTVKCSQCRFASTKRDQTRNAFAEKVNRSLHGDEHGDTLSVDFESKRIHTAVGDLPISPVMDPSWIEAQQRFRTPKPKAQAAGKSKGRFRKKLAHNPFAHALAQPWRLCAVSGEGMPRYFLQKFELARNPEDQRPWLVPADLDRRHDDAQVLEAADGDSAEHDLDPIGSNIPPVEQVEASPAISNSTQGTTGGLLPRAIPSGYVVSRQDLVGALSDTSGNRKSLLRGRYRTMLARRPSVSSSGILGQIVWRGDMDLFLLDEMRRRVVSGLLQLAQQEQDGERSKIVPCSSWTEINKDVTHRGCVLWYATRQENGDAPGPMATLDIDGATYERTIPVHNLDRLLGEEWVKKLRENALFRDYSLLLVRKPSTNNVQLDLWKLQGYMAAEVVGDIGIEGDHVD